MKLLLDTHAFVWAIARSQLLSRRAARLIEDTSNPVLVSAVSAYEIEFKRSRDPALAALPADLDEAVRPRGFKAEGLTLRRIAETLNADGVPSPGGASWNPGNVQRALARVAA